MDPGESKNSKRWTRIARASGIIAKTVPGFKWEAGTRSFEVTGLLEQKVGSWREEERMEREEEERWNGEERAEEMEIENEERRREKSEGGVGWVEDLDLMETTKDRRDLGSLVELGPQ